MLTHTHNRAISITLLSTMLIGCAERIVEPTADVTVKVEYADGRTEYAEFSHAEINTARANLPRDFTGIDTTGFTITKQGATVRIAKDGGTVATIERSNGTTVVTANGNKYTVRGEIPLPTRSHENVTLAMAMIPCWMYVFMWISAVGSLLACVTIIGCAAALSAMAGVIAGAESDGCISDERAYITR